MTAFVGGKTPEIASRLLAIAESQGLDALVIRATENGFNVPDSVEVAYASPGEQPSKPVRRSKTVEKE